MPPDNARHVYATPGLWFAQATVDESISVPTSGETGTSIRGTLLSPALLEARDTAASTHDTK
eukprot:6469102-Amphidinium_carterae.1